MSGMMREYNTKLDIQTIRNGKRYLVYLGQSRDAMAKIIDYKQGSSLMDFITVEVEGSEIPLTMRVGDFKKKVIREIKLDAEKNLEKSSK